MTTDGNAKQSQYDLNAQQDMAEWALGMLIIAFWLTLITLGGVFFVWRTLKATQDMAKSAKEIGDARVRASALQVTQTQAANRIVHEANVVSKQAVRESSGLLSMPRLCLVYVEQLGSNSPSG